MSNLLDKSSIVLTPTAYDNSKVLCVKPSDASGDFQFSRNSAATRVNAQGLVENVQILSSNLVQNPSFSEEGAEQVTNGNFATDSDWSLGTGWSIGDGVLKLTTTSTDNTSQAIGLVQNNFYKITFTISDTTLGGVRIRLGVGALSGSYSNGTHTIHLEQTTTNDAFRIYSNSSGVFNGSITNISVKEVGQNWTLETGWSIGTDKAISDGSGSVPSTDLVQSNVFTSGNTYKVSLKIQDYVSGRLELQNNTTDFPQANGTHTIYLVAGGGTAIVLRSRGFNGSITNISVIEITDDTNLPRINYEGFSYQDALGNELIDYSTFTSPSASWSLVGGLWVFDDTANGYLTTPSIAVVVGDTYKVVVDVTIASGNANFRYASSNNQTRLFNFTDFVDGLNTFTATVEGVDGILSRLFAPASLTDNPFTLNSISIKKINGQEVVPDSGCGSWLFEPQTTQLLPYSEDYSQSSWSKGSDISIESGYLAPDGNNTAYKVTKTGGGAPYLTRNQSLITTTTRSIYARTVSGTGTATLLSHNSNTNNLFTLTEQWQRFELSDTTSSTGATSFYAADFRGSGTLTEYLIWGANATNDQDYATSYIPTSGSSVTRNQDLCTNGGSLATINSTEGVLYAEIAGITNDGTFKVISLSDGSTSNVVRFYKNTTDNQLSIRVTSSGVNYFNQIFNLSNSNATNKVALKYKENDFAFWVNGIEVKTDNNGITPIGLNVLNFSEGNGISPFYGKTKALAVWKEALTDAELTALTTI